MRKENLEINSNPIKNVEQGQLQSMSKSSRPHSPNLKQEKKHHKIKIENKIYLDENEQL